MTMSIISFEALVSEEGTIKLPENLHLENQKIEVVILPKANAKGSALDFVKKWAGVIKGSEGNIEKTRLEFLEKKHL